MADKLQDEITVGILVLYVFHFRPSISNKEWSSPASHFSGSSLRPATHRYVGYKLLVQGD